MSLSANMWTSVSGLMTHGEKMNVIGNNLANVSTIGFKAQRADFSDFIYTNYGTASGQDQMGKGTAICALIGDFSQGGFESTNSATDLAINGNGFFKVRSEGNDSMHYTRAGDFYFDKDRQLVNPSGMILQGWETSQTKSVSFGKEGTITVSSSVKSDDSFRRTGAVKDIVLDKWNIPPQRTTNITIANSLVNDDKYDTCQNPASPLTSLFDSWNAKNTVPLSDDAYATQSTITAYDEGGTSHNLTVYMDKVRDHLVDTDGQTLYEIEGLPAGYSVYEYLVTMDPSEDKRMSGGVYDPVSQTYTTPPTKLYSEDPDQRAEKAGVLMSGIMVFNASGELVSQSAYTYGGNSGNADPDTKLLPEGQQDSLDIDDKTSWQPTKFSNNGLPVFTANFSGKATANTVCESESEGSLIELDLGLGSSLGTWTGEGSLADLTVNEEGKVDFNQVALMNGAIPDSDATANNGSSFISNIQDDGYKAGVLSNYTIDTSGVVYGYYNNGESLPLYQIAMYDFHNLQGLYREGGNLYAPTKESGRPMEGVAGTGTFGDVTSYYIENSNVDMSREFVQMISCQRGFQANSKSITTTDTMLETVIGMKR